MNYVGSGYVRTGYIRRDADVVGNFTFDGYGKYIFVNDGVTSISASDMHSRWVEWLSIDDNSKYQLAMKYSGYDEIPSGFTGATYFLINGWKLIYSPNETSVSGVLFSDTYATAYFDKTYVAVFPVQVSAVVNNVVSTQNIVTGTVVTAAEIWAYVDRQLTVASGMSPAQEAKLNAIPTNPLLTTDIRLNHLDADISSGAGLSTIQNDKLLSLGTPTEIVTTLMNTPLPIAPTTNTFGDLIKNQIITLLRLKKFL